VKLKYEFWTNNVSFLWHVISKEGVLVDPSKVDAIVDWSKSSSLTEIRSFFESSWLLSEIC